jgi:hypothetical protein
VVLHFTVPALGFGEPRLLTCSRARPQPVVWIAPACARVLRVSAVLPGHVLSPWFGEPRRVRAFCARLPCSPGTSSALCSASPGACARSARVCRAPQARPQPLVRRAPARARVLRESAVLPGHVLSPLFGEPRRVRAFCARLPCSPGTSSALDDDRPFIVLTETKPSKRHIPVWARYSPLTSQLLLSLCCALFSAICALRAVCFVTCVVPSGGCQPGSARLLSYGSFASAAQRSHCMFMQWDRMDS